jgi:hypothetical protein
MLMLSMMGVIGLAALDTVTLDQQVAGYQSRKRISFYAAEAGVAEALSTLQATGIPSISPGSTIIGDASSYPYGQPSYSIAPGTTIDKIGAGNMDGMTLNISEGARSKYQLEFWKFEVEGSEQAGTASRLEVASGRFVGN